MMPRSSNLRLLSPQSQCLGFYLPHHSLAYAPVIFRLQPRLPCANSIATWISGPFFLPPSLSGTAALDGLRPSRALQHGGLLLPLVPRGPAGFGSPAILPDRR